MKKIYSLILVVILFAGKGYSQNATIGKVNSLVADTFNSLWVATPQGLYHLSGRTNAWKKYSQDSIKGSLDNFKDICLFFAKSYPEIFAANDSGVAALGTNVDGITAATTFKKENGRKWSSDTIYSVTIDDSSRRWFGTYNGPSGWKSQIWYTMNFAAEYSTSDFINNPITDIQVYKDTLYIATNGLSVARFSRDTVNGKPINSFTGASRYQKWGPCPMPSQVYNIFIDKKTAGTQWYATAEGVIKHVGTEFQTGWTTYTKTEGLVGDSAFSIAKGKDSTMYFGTNEGLSAFKNDKWTNYTSFPGITGKKVYSIAIAKDSGVWVGTDAGVSKLKKGEWTSYNDISAVNVYNPENLADVVEGMVNYPNPANQSTVVAYTQAIAGDVTSYLVDINGKVIDSYAVENQPAGKYAFVLNTANYASGNYYLLLNVNGKQVASVSIVIVH